MRRKTELDATAIGLMVMLCALWGFQQVTIKVANEAIPPVFQAGLRSVVAVLLVGVWATARRIPLNVRDGSFLPGVVAGLLFATEFAMIYWALTFTTAARAVLFIYTSPFVVAAGVHWLVPGESLGRWQVSGLACAFVGVVAAFADNISMPLGNQWIGDLLALGASVLWGATTVVIRASRLATVSATKTLIYQLAISAMLLPFASMALGEHDIRNPTLLTWAALAYQSVVVAFASYLVWFWLITRYPAGRLAAFSFLTPLFGMLFGAIVLGERITPSLGLAMGLVAVGLWMVNRRKPITITEESGGDDACKVPIAIAPESGRES